MSVVDADDRARRSPLLDGRQLLAFRAVATELSFTRAAASLGYVQSSVTAQVQGLERDLGTRLFERLGRTVQLTDGGRRLLEHVDELLAVTASARVAVTGHVAGTLTVGAPDTLCAYRLPAIMRSFRRQHPDVRVTFSPTRSSPAARRAVLDGDVDVALMLDEEIDERQVIAERLAPEPLVFLVAPDHPLAAVDGFTLEHLAGEAAVLTEAGCGYREMLERRLRARAIVLGNVMEFPSLEAIKACVRVGMGVTVLPVVAVERELDTGELVALRWAGPALEIGCHLVVHRDKWRSPALTTFLDDLRGAATSHGVG